MGTQREQALTAWLNAISKAGWRRATVDTAAEASGLSAAEVAAALGDRIDALAAFQDQVAAEAAAGAGQGATVRDRLFDGMMQGFDAIQPHRAAVLAVRRSRDPGVAMLLAGRAGLHVRRLAIAAGMDVHGLRGHLRLAALAGLLWQAFAAWSRDESPDMSATMAEMDRLLERAERAETEGLSPDIVGLPGVTAAFGRLRRTAGRAGPVPPPSPGQTAE